MTQRLTLKQLKPSDYLNGARTIKVNESYNIDDIVGFWSMVINVHILLKCR